MDHGCSLSWLHDRRDDASLELCFIDASVTSVALPPKLPGGTALTRPASGHFTPFPASRLQALVYLIDDRSWHLISIVVGNGCGRSTASACTCRQH